jgi:hypothetical protein
MKDTVKSIPNNRASWLRTHTLTPEQRQQLIAQKLERARQQFEARAKIPILMAWDAVVRQREPQHHSKQLKWAACGMESLLWDEKLQRIKAYWTGPLQTQ